MTALLTPVDKGKARQSGATLWRKQLLPIGTINYKGRSIAFTREYLAGLVKAFSSKAYDVVPFQFADHANTHTNDPERRRGTVRGMELTADGLDIIVEPGPGAAEHLKDYPDLGVSARIVEAYDRADGKFFPAAIQHVLGTLDPRIPGLKPWRAVEAANDSAPLSGLWEAIDFSGDDPGEVIDLTVMEYATEPPETAPAAPDSAAKPQEEEASMAFTPEQEARLTALLDLPKDQFDAIISPKAEEVTEDADETGDDEITDEQLQALLDEVDAETETVDADTTEDREPEPAGASLTAEAQQAIDLANARAEEQGAELRRMRAQLDRATYEKERDHYQRVLGIPARITDLGRPLLEGSGRTVELANGKSTDAGAIVRNILSEVGKTFQSLGMDIELGNAEGADIQAQEAEQQDENRGKFVKDYTSTYSL
jgi:hypothetical protein